MRLLTWQFQRMDRPLPPAPELQALSRKIVSDAHRIATERGKNVITILREMVGEWIKSSKSDSENR